MDMLKIIGENVREFRKIRGYSQEALAKQSTFKRSYIGDVERGERNMTIETLVQLATALDVQAPVLLIEGAYKWFRPAKRTRSQK